MDYQYVTSHKYISYINEIYYEFNYFKYISNLIYIFIIYIIQYIVSLRLYAFGEFMNNQKDMSDDIYRIKNI